MLDNVRPERIVHMDGIKKLYCHDVDRMQSGEQRGWPFPDTG
ncbi:MAG: hypothetical protein H6R08_783 [Proteobacteria bacterium]|jgi:hypothetical protein|nr:hypothetical protein [Pseudomonadota bacterium]